MNFFNIQRFAEDSGLLKNELTGFVPIIQATEIIKLAVRGSAILRLSRVEQLESDNKKFPVMAKGVGAYWVEEGEKIQTSKPDWIFPQLNVKKLGVIVPVTREKMEDTTINVFNEVTPYIAEAFATKIDSSCFFGIDSPFARNFYDAIMENGMAVAVGTNDKLDLDISDVMAAIESKGFDASAFAADISFKNSLRKLRDANGNQLYFQGAAANLDYDTLYSMPIDFCRSGAWDKTKAICICGDFRTYSIVGIRSQIEYKILTEATLTTVTTGDGKPLSLAERDLVAIRATMRLGFLPVKEDAFAMLVPAGTVIPTPSTPTPSTDDTDTTVTPTKP